MHDRAVTLGRRFCSRLSSTIPTRSIHAPAQTKATSFPISTSATFSTASLLGVGQRTVAHARGCPVVVHEHHALEPVGIQKDGAGGDLTGLRVWEAAPMLIQHLSDHATDLVEGRSVLDVGAGTGAVGLAAAALGAEAVVLSEADSPASATTPHGWQTRSTLAMLADNIQLNGTMVSSVTSVAELRWGCREHIERLLSIYPIGFDTLTLSDVLYYPPDTHAQLAETVSALTRRAEAAGGRQKHGGSVVIAYKVRHGQEHTFVERLTSSGFVHVVRDGLDDLHGKGGVCRGGGASDGGFVEVTGDGGPSDEPELAPRNSMRVVELRRCGN